MDNFKIQKKLQQIPDVAEDQQQTFIDEIYKDLAELQLSLFMHTIESVKIPDAEIDDQALILDWLKNSDRNLFAQIKETLEKNRDIWNIPPQQVQCGSCQQPNKIDLILDQATFFV